MPDIYLRPTQVAPNDIGLCDPTMPCPQPNPPQPAIATVSGGGLPLHFDPKDWQTPEKPKKKREKKRKPAPVVVELEEPKATRKPVKAKKVAPLASLARHREEEELLLLGVL